MIDMLELDADNYAREHANRRNFLYAATGSVAVFGGAALTVPFTAHMRPAAESVDFNPLAVDLTDIAEGDSKKVLWYNEMPVVIRHRTAEEIAAAQNAELANLPVPESDDDRLKVGVNGEINRKFMGVVSTCPREGCVAVSRKGDFDGWYCPCCSAHYDTSGRYRRGIFPANMMLRHTDMCRPRVWSSYI